MADKQKKETADNPSRQRSTFDQPTTVTAEAAFEVFAGMDPPSLNGLARLLRDMGHKVSVTTIHRWSKKHGWAERIASLGKLDDLNLIEMGNAAKALGILSKEGARFDVVASVKGLQSRIVRVLGDRIVETGKEAERPDYFIAMTKLLSDLEELKRKGYQTDVQQGGNTKPVEIVPAAAEAPKEEVPALAKVKILHPFSKPGGKK